MRTPTIFKEKNKRLLLFLHIPKCAGTTLVEEILCRRFRPERLLTHYIAGTDVLLERLRNMSEREKRRLECIAGHFAFGIHELLPQPCAYITLLRNPIERVISHYYYAATTPRHPLYHEIKNRRLSLRQYVNDLENIEMDNGQTRLLAGIGQGAPFGQCGDHQLRKAMANLQSGFVLAGLTERFEDFLRILTFILNWKIPAYHSRNVTAQRPMAVDIDHETRKCIEKMNRLDRCLFEFVSARFQDQFESMVSVSRDTLQD